MPQLLALIQTLAPQTNTYLAQIIMFHSNLPEKEVNITAILDRMQKMGLWRGRETQIYKLSKLLEEQKSILNVKS